MESQLTIIVPLYNEEANLERLAKELDEFLKIAHVSTQVLFVNDGSTDYSQILIEGICMNRERYDFITLTQNQGLSTALKVGFDHVNTNLIGYIDADLQTAPKDFNLLLEHIKDYDLVTGIRSNRKDGIIKRIASSIANTVRRILIRDGIKDTGCPLKIIKADYAKRIPMFRGLHRFLPAMVLLQNGTVKQVPVAHYPRTAGISKFGLWQRLISSLQDCFAYLWMKKRYIRYTVLKRSETDYLNRNLD